ncbi:MAG: polysaccharide biosynthesis tyrosine autokinase [Rhodobacteraceae bacterium]|nr:polysaccharide biosynthesis tyrosine autokinase [Paracoccaceae bacterium]
MTMPPPENDDEIDIGQLIGTLWAGKTLIVLCMVLGTAAAAFFVANTRPTFQADALLQLEERSGALALPSSLSDMVASDPRSVTEIEILNSRMVLGQAVADLNLDWRVSPTLVPLIGTMIARYDLPFVDTLLADRFARKGDRVLLDQLVVPPGWLNQDLSLDVIDSQHFRLTLPDGQMLAGTVGQASSLPETGFSLAVSEIAAPAGRSFALTQLDEIRAIADLRERLSVSERGRASGILEVRLTGADRQGNARALNAIIQAYLRQNVARSAAEAESSLAFIRQQLPQAERDLRAAEAALNAFRQQQVTVDLTLETQAILGQITRIEGELVQLQRQEDEVAQRYTPAHPAYRQLLDERARLEVRLADLRLQVGALPETQRQILNLSSAVELAQGIYTELLTRAQEVEVLRASTIGNVRIIDSAASATLAVAPRKALILALGLVLGAMAGVALVLIRGWMRRGVRDASELENLGLPVLATINYNKAADSGGKRQGKLPIFALEQSADLTVEALRSLRTSLHFGMLDARTPTLTVASSHPGAGKSFLSVNLAIVAAQAGQRVCLIDADLRRGQLRRHFDLARNQPGLSEVLAGDLRIEEAIVQGPLEGLFFLPTGRYPPNPSELLMRSELSRLIDWCAQNYDLTIFDSPPALAVTDPVILGRNTGSTILVVKHDITPLSEVEAAIKTFASAGVRMSGAVLNSFDPRKAHGAYGYGYGYRYEYKQRKQ